MFQQYQLPNGANIILVPQHDTKSLTTLIMYPVGSRYEPEKMSGVSHYIEHMMFKGTKKRKTAQVLTREIDRLGAEYNAFTSKEYTGYYIKADASFADISLDILSDMLFHSVFDPKECEKEKGPIIEELRMYQDNPLMNIDTVFEKVLYRGALGRDIGGTPKHVSNYLRHDVLAFRNTYYAASNMTVVVAGAVDERVRAMVASFVGGGPTRPQPKNTYASAVFGSAKKEDRLMIQKKQTDQVQLMLGFPAFAYGDPRNPATSVLTTILGGSMSSRLFEVIREKHGLAYTVRAGAEQYHDTGYVYVRAGLEPKNVNKAIGLIQKELNKMVEKPVTKRELADAKTHIRGGLTLRMEDSSAQANWYASGALFHKKIRTPEQYLKRIEAVTVDHIQRAATQVFKISQMRLALIGDLESKDVHF